MTGYRAINDYHFTDAGFLRRINRCRRVVFSRLDILSIRLTTDRVTVTPFFRRVSAGVAAFGIGCCIYRIALFVLAARVCLFDDHGIRLGDGNIGFSGKCVGIGARILNCVVDLLNLSRRRYGRVTRRGIE